MSYVGRGRNQKVVYVFGEEAGGIPNAEALELLLREGLPFTSAYSLARRYPLGHIKARLERYRAFLEGGYRPKNRLGFLVDVIQDQTGKYQDPSGAQPPRRAQPPEAAEEAVEEEAAREWETLPLEARIRRALQVVHLVLRSRITVGELEELARRMEGGLLDPKGLVEELKEALAEGRVGDWLERFRKTLPSP